MSEKKGTGLGSLKIYGAPWYIAVFACVVIIASAYLGVLGTDFASMMALIIAYGIIFFEIGEVLPIWNTYIGGGVLAAFFGTAIVKQLGLVPKVYIEPINEFIGGDQVGFYPIDSAVTAGLCMANRGGNGDVAVLGAAKRMDLMAYAQLSSRLGGGIVLIIASFIFSFIK